MSDTQELKVSCAFCGGDLSNPKVFEGDTYRYVEVRGCCYDVEFFAPEGFKLDTYPYGKPLSEWPEDFQREVVDQMNTRPAPSNGLTVEEVEGMMIPNGRDHDYAYNAALTDVLARLTKPSEDD